MFMVYYLVGPHYPFFIFFLLVLNDILRSHGVLGGKLGVVFC